MLDGLRQLFAPRPDPYSDPKAKIPLGEVLSRNWFELWYQPKIELRSMRLVGAEALVRARHPVRGVVPPFFFLPDANEEDMLKLTEQVILTALGDWDIFNEYGVPMKFAVNVPVSAFVKLPIPRMLREARPKSANWPGMMLEVTEDQIIHDLDLANDVGGGAARAELQPRARRFRRRLFLAGAAAPAAVQRTQDRPQLRDELRHATRSMPACARPSSNWPSASA